MYERPCNSNTLHFTPRKVLRRMPEAVPEAYLVEHGASLRCGNGWFHAREQQWQANIVQCTQGWQKMKGLENKSDMGATDEGQCIIIQAPQFNVIDVDPS